MQKADLLSVALRFQVICRDTERKSFEIEQKELYSGFLQVSPIQI